MPGVGTVSKLFAKKEGRLSSGLEHEVAVLRFSPIKTPDLTITTRKATTAKSSVNVKGITSGSVTNVTYRIGKTSRFKAARGTARWRFRAKLNPGKNKISVIANGPGGASAPKTVVITRR